MNQKYIGTQFSSAHFSRSVVSDSLWPHGQQNAKFACPSQIAEACSNSCPSSHWCHPTISSSVVCFSSHFQSFPASGYFPVSQLFKSGGQRIRTSDTTSVLPMNIQGWFPLGLTGLIFLAVQGTLKSLPQHHISKASILQCSSFFMVQLSHPYMTTGKTIALTIWTFIGDVISLLFNMLSKFVIAFLPRNMEWGHLGSDENTLCLDFGTGCMSLDICPNSSDCTARRNKFTCM